ncbi:MAG: tyrosine--tRNA ligase [Microthrixaceae bacterium]
MESTTPTAPADDAPSALLADLARRGLVQDHTDLGALAGRLAAGPTPLYCGFDPTADSLHVGNLQSIMLLRRFQLAGHPPVALVGGATGMIGDPGGRTSERTFLDPEVLDANREAIGVQLARFLDPDAGPASARLVDNREWTEPMGVLEFLRDVGKHITVNTMLAKESVQGRIERESGISFTEFSYMLLQANDFLQLHQAHGVDLQVAGSDQWGNITAGVDLVRRRTGDTVHGLTAPLIVRADGTKFGKSEGENVWLSAERTSPFRMYQFLLNVADDDVDGLLLRLTTVPTADVAELAATHAADPAARTAQRRLAREVVSLVHGAEVVGPVEDASAVLFSGAPLADAAPATLDLVAEEVGRTLRSRAEVVGADPLDLLVAAGVARSKGEARKNATGYSLNGVTLAVRGLDPVTDGDLLHDRFLVLRRGRSAHHVVEAAAL